MCGIAGWYRRGRRPVARETIVMQCNRIVHRGPDDSGELVDGDFGFGMRRLSIIDVAGGHQPITTEDGRYSIVFNGEIYNHLELRDELGTAGYAFRTRSDTETLLLCFVHWQDDAWLKLEGMYAVAIWDHVSRILTLARDPLGVKPLYFTQQHDGLAFASELRALKVLPDHRFDIDERAVHDFFSFGHVQKPRSIYQQVRSLEPGNVLHLGPSGAPKGHAFWRPRFRIREGMSEKDWIEETRERVLRTVKQHMLADVPVGAFLSGGVDSGAVTAAMTRSTSTGSRRSRSAFRNRPSTKRTRRGGFRASATRWAIFAPISTGNSATPTSTARACSSKPSMPSSSASGSGSVEPSEWLSSPGPQWPVDPTVGNHPIAGYHHMGTTRMSADPAEGVVTADCNVFGYDNLFVAGSSVFSTSGWANPTLTIVALALRLADHLDGKLKAAPAPARDYFTSAS